jgi:hypothetical protein
MRAAMSGYVMNISSTSGIRGAPCYDFYTGWWKYSSFIFNFYSFFLFLKLETVQYATAEVNTPKFIFTY